MKATRHYELEASGQGDDRTMQLVKRHGSLRHLRKLLDELRRSGNHRYTRIVRVERSVVAPDEVR